MVKLLISRPVGVIMVFIAVLMLGIVSYRLLPMSLMPDIDIPEITVQINYPNNSARELENAVVKNLRSQLMQVANVADINSETRDGRSTIRISFEYGTSIDYAFIEVNEKIDASMGYFPRDMNRPRVIKASATDLPVFYLNVALKSDEVSPERFIQLSEFSEDVISKRIEQLKEVAMVDMSGTMSPEIVIKPDMSKIKSLKLGLGDIEQAINGSTIDAGNIMVLDGYYQYQIRFTSKLRTVKDVEKVYLRARDKILQIKDIADVEIHAKKPQGLFISRNKQAITMAIIQQADVKMANLKVTLGELIDQFQKDYPELQFEIAKDQSQLLEVSMSNLQQDLFMGAIMAFVILFLFLGDFRAPVLIGITIPLSLIISFLFFNMFGLSLNIISLAGLTLGLGMIIDCSIIVIENILHHYHNGSSLDEACDKGTTEVIRPMISSTLSTSAVFLPLIFLSGMAGALFYDEAVSVSLGNGASLIVAITILPVLFKLFYKKKDKPLTEKTKVSVVRKVTRAIGLNGRVGLLLKKINVSKAVERWYENGVAWVFRNKKKTTYLFFMLIAMNVGLFSVLKKEKFPALPQTESIVNIEWNENIHLNENRRRIEQLVNELKPELETSNCQIGEQQFMLNQQVDLDYFESELYLKVKNKNMIKPLEDKALSIIGKRFPLAKVSFRPPTTIFERIFSNNESPLLAKVSVSDIGHLNPDSVLAFVALADERVHARIPNRISLKQQIAISVDQEKLLVYGVDFNMVNQSVKTAFNQYEFGTLQSNQRFMPMVFGDDSGMAVQALQSRSVMNSKGEEFPLTTFIRMNREQDLKSVIAGQQGEYIPLRYDVTSNQVDEYQAEIKKLVSEKNYPDVNFEGSLKSNNKLFGELAVILLISLLLLYFILAAQFESLLQPFIVLMEIPANISGAFFLLWVFDNSLNIMSGIGIIVGCGVFINDSIIKVDTINQLRKNGMELIPAIKKGGLLRIGGILMTAATTILAVTPFLFGNDLGSVLQKPLSLALIGGMIVGTFVSLFFVPLVYWWIYKKDEMDNTQLVKP